MRANWSLAWCEKLAFEFVQIGEQVFVLFVVSRMLPATFVYLIVRCVKDFST